MDYELTEDENDQLLEYFSTIYSGTADDMEEAFDAWCSDLTAEDVKRFLA